MAQEPSELDNTETTQNDTAELNRTSATQTETQTGDASNTITESGTSDQTEIASETEEIRVQIEETRASMSETLDAIGEKLSFANISEQVKDQFSEQVDTVIKTVKDSVYSATVGKAENLMKNAGDIMKKNGKDISKTQMFKMAQDNPLPLALIGLGVGLLIFGKSKRRNNFANYRVKSGDAHYDKNQSQQRQSKSSALSSAQRKIGDAASGAFESVSGAASSVYQGAGDYAGQAYEAAGDYGTQLRQKYSRLSQENPLVIGAVAVAVGAALGLAIPSTQYENELMGEAKQNLMLQAQDSTGDLIGKVKDFVSDAGQKIGDQVKEQAASK